MLNRFCCMRLNTFGIFLGWLGIVGSFFGIILTSIGLARADDIAKFIHDNMQGKPNLDVNGISNMIVLVCSVYLGFSLIGLLSSSLLVIGTVKERHLLLLPWLINSGIGFLFNIIYHLSMVSMLISNGDSFGNVAPVIILIVLSIVLQFYIIYAIYSLYKQIQATRDAQVPLVRPTGPNYPSYTKI